MDIVAITFIIYLLTMLSIGFIGFRSSTTIESFYVADRNIGKVLSTGTFLGSFVSAVAILGYIGQSYSSGYGVLINSLGCIFAFYVIYYLFAPKIKDNFDHLLTIPEIFEDIFGGKALKVVSSLITVSLYILLLVMQIKGGALVVANVLGIAYGLSLSIITTVFIIYTVLGGLRTVIYTDLIQTSILTIGVLIAVPVALYTVGGISSLNAQLETINPINLDPTNEGMLSTFSLFLAFALGIGSSQYYLTRVYSAKDHNTAKFMIAASAFIWMLIGFSTAILGGAAQVLFPNLDNPDNAFLALAGEFHPVFNVIVLIAITSAIMSTTDTVLLGAGTYLSRDIFQGWLVPNASDGTTLKITRYSMVVVGLLAGILAFNSPALIMEITTANVSLIGSTFFAPMICALYWKNTTKEGVLSGVLVGGAIVVLLQFILPTTINPIMPAVLGSFITIILVSLFFPGKPSKFLNKGV